MPSYQSPSQTTSPPDQSQPAPAQQQPAPVYDGWMSYYGYTPQPPAPVSTDLLDVAEQGAGGNTTSGVGEGSTTFNGSTYLQTLEQLAGERIPLALAPDGDGGWVLRTSQEVGPFSNETTVSDDGHGGTTVATENKQDFDVIEFTQGMSIGRSVTNDRWTGDESNLAYDMMRMVGGTVDVVGMQDKVNTHAGFSTTDDLPISLAHDEALSTGHDAYHFLRSDGSAMTDQQRDDLLGRELGDMDGVSDFGLDAFADMVPGEGFAFVDRIDQSQSTEVGLHRKMGPLDGSLTVGFGSGDADIQQTMISKKDDHTVSISLVQGDGDMSSATFGVGVSRDTDGKPGGFSLNASVGTQVDDVNTTQVAFDIDVSTPEGQEQLRQFTTTGLLPGADRIDAQDEAHQAQLDEYAQARAALDGMDPDSAEYAEAQAEIYAMSGELNNTFMNRNTFRESQEAVPDSVSYTEWVSQQEQTVTHSASFWAWQMSRVGRVEREWDRFGIDNGEFDFEAGFYQDTQFTEGDAVVVASPNAAPDLALAASSRTDMGIARQMVEQGVIPPGALPPDLMQAVFEDGLNDFNDGGMQITTALTDAQMTLLAQNGMSVDDLLQTPEYLPYWLTDGNAWEHRSFVHESIGELAGESTNDTEGYYSDDELAAFATKYGDENNDPSEAFLAATSNLNQDQFLNDLSPLEREVLIEVRSKELLATGQNPWEVLALVDAIPDAEERTRLHRELFESIENTAVAFEEYGLESGPWTNGIIGADGNNSASALLMMHMSDVAQGLDPAQAEFLMSGLRVELVDKRAADWANSRILDPLEDGQTRDQVLDNLVEEHVNWSIEHENYDQLSDNFQAVAMAGGPDMVVDLVGKMGGEDAIRQILNDTYADDPRRLAIYGQALAGTPYYDLVEQARHACL
ncbi:MAG: hypothetical protein H6738_00885 [Alphaproteobacteria bacterium]|nr:hypothetical protein [Alphaproteobacteria bacterium]MCB9695323.1 hypothetical protein [Alphaproteobacteria bacterium]